MTKLSVLELLDAAVELAGRLVKQDAGDDEEAEQGRTPAQRDHVSDLPEVPAEDTDAVGGTTGDAGRERALAHEAVAQAAEVLQELLSDPQLVGGLDDEQRERVEVAARYLTEQPRGGFLAKAVDIPLSVKAIIKDDDGRTLVLRDAYSDYWDLPGGHVQDGEPLDQALKREVHEETGLRILTAKRRLVKVLKLGRETKPVIFYDVAAKGRVRCSDEHTGYQWAGDEELGRLNLGVFKAVLIPTAQERYGGPGGGTGTQMPESERGGDSTQFYRGKYTDGMLEDLQQRQRKVGEESEVVNPRLREAQVVEVEPAVGGRRGVGSTTVKDVTGAGDATVGVDVHTPVGGGGRRRRDLKWLAASVGNVEKMARDYDLRRGDSEEVLKSMPAGSVSCVVTSPSYWGPKMAVGFGELGGEREVGQYVTKLVRVFKEAQRVLRDDGSLWVVLGDGAHDNSQLSVPFLLSAALQKDGWRLHRARVWQKGKSNQDTLFQFNKVGRRPYQSENEYDLPSIIRLNQQAMNAEPGSRFMQFPVELGELLVRHSCPPEGVVLDPFVGTGTTLLAARNLGLAGIGIDVDAGELAIAQRRLGAGTSAYAGVKVQKGVVDGAARYDMFVLAKAQDSGQPFVVAGYASPVLVDQEGHRITHEALRKDLPRFMADGGKYANVNVMHSNVTVGRLLPQFTDKGGRTWKTQVDDKGLFVVAELRTDPAAPEIVHKVIEDIEKGALRSFSISGNAENPTFRCDGDRCFYDINELELYEITLCQEGVNQDARFDVISKAVTKNADAPAMPDAELLRYFGAFKTLFSMHHRTGPYEVCLYDRSTGEVLEPDDEAELVDDDDVA